MAPFLRARDEGVVLSVYVQPRASRNQLVGVQGEELKVRLTSPPVEGAANALCCEYLAKLLRVPKGAVALIGGEKSRHKRLLVYGAGVEELRRAIEEALA